MKTTSSNLPNSAVGVAYNGYVPSFINCYPGLIDYVEVPFELLRHDPGVADLCNLPIILHCASLSIGGDIPCSQTTLREIEKWVDLTSTPWIGEHLAFITAGYEGSSMQLPVNAESEPYNIGYTISPPMNEMVLERTVRNLENYQQNFNVKFLLENSPLYFSVPTTTMSQAEFFHELCTRTDVGILLDLTHLYITSQNMNFDPLAELQKFPLERVVEIHISGVDLQSGNHWDDHAKPAPDIIYKMLAQLLQSVIPKAVTLEYNWARSFPPEILLKELIKVRETLEYKLN